MIKFFKEWRTVISLSLSVVAGIVLSAFGIRVVDKPFAFFAILILFNVSVQQAFNYLDSFGR